MLSLLMLAAAAAAPAPPVTRAYRSLLAEFRQFEAERARDYPLLQIRLLARSQQPGQDVRGLELRLRSASVDQRLPLPLFAGAELPRSPLAEREDGMLALNRPAGSFNLGTQYAVALCPDGRYPVADLRAACEQGLRIGKTFELGRRMAHMRRHCVGVVLRFAHTQGAAMFHAPGAAPRPVPVRARTLFGQAVDDIPFRFADWPAPGEVRTGAAPEVIDFLIE